MMKNMNHFLKSRIEPRVLEIMAQEECGPVLSFQGFLRLLSAGYQAGIQARAVFYANGWLPRKKLPCPVISIGNIMAGGTGKTPVAISIAQMLTRMGKSSVIISRGYKADSSSGPVLVGDGKQVFSNVQLAGDEPYMMAKDFSLAVVTGKKRYEAGCFAIETLSPDVIILDDGFQHLALERDLDLVLLDCQRPFGNKRLLPAGFLREPVKTALQRCHAIIRTRCPESPEPFCLPKTLSEPGFSLPVFNTSHCPALVGWQDAHHTPLPLETKNLAGKKVVLFSGIARNHEFKKTMEKLGCLVVNHLEFSDHHRYTLADLDGIKRRMKQDNADLAVTTQKDMVKIDSAAFLSDSLWPGELAVMGVTIKWENKTAIQNFLSSVLLKIEAYKENS